MMQKSTTSSLAHYDTDALLEELNARQQASDAEVAGRDLIISNRTRSQSLIEKGRGIIQNFRDRLEQPDNDILPLPQTGTRAAASFAASLTFENIERRFDQAYALRGVSLEIKAGELVCLLGPSGCGKTTLLRLASGIETPTAGRILLNNHEVAGPERIVPPEKRNVGLMFQDFALFPHLTVLQNVAYGLTNLNKKLAQKEAMSALARIELERFANHYPHTLSGGQQQRVALARAIAPRPAVMLMDEPFSGLDVYLRASLRRTTRELLKETRSTGIIVTHDPVEAVQMADRIVVMRNGRIVQVGHANELYRNPTDLFVARLFSEVNELPATVENGVIEMPFGRFPAPGFSDGAKVILCVRQRAVRPDWKGISGRILAAQFQGDLVQLTIGVTGLDKPLTSLMREEMTPAVGNDVMINVDPKGTMIFAADE
ncbi:MAG: ABC transporter ATP-binding protein [Pseudomonadota bacterium]